MKHKLPATELLEYRLREIPELTAEMSAQERHAVVMDMYAIAYNAAFVAELTFREHKMGYTHAVALASANRVRNRVRRALGLQRVPPLSV
jgi:hypothetical protein